MRERAARCCSTGKPIRERVELRVVIRNRGRRGQGRRFEPVARLRWTLKGAQGGWPAGSVTVLRNSGSEGLEGARFPVPGFG